MSYWPKEGVSNLFWRFGHMPMEHKNPFSTLALVSAADHKKSAAICEDNGAVLNGSGKNSLLEPFLLAGGLDEEELMGRLDRIKVIVSELPAA